MKKTYAIFTSIILLACATHASAMSINFKNNTKVTLQVPLFGIALAPTENYSMNLSDDSNDNNESFDESINEILPLYQYNGASICTREKTQIPLNKYISSLTPNINEFSKLVNGFDEKKLNSVEYAVSQDEISGAFICMLNFN